MPGLVIGLDAIALQREAWRASEPDPAAAAVLAEIAGAAGISVGLRSDRRHVQERDVKVLRAIVRGELQVRVAPTPESVKVVTPLRPDLVVLVPEREGSLAGEGGLDLSLSGTAVSEAAGALREAGIEVMVLVDPDPEAVKAAHRLGVRGVCLSGRRLATARHAEARSIELASLDKALRLATRLSLRTQVGQGLDLACLGSLASLPGLGTVEVGHAACARAALVGMSAAVTAFCAALGRS